MLHPNSCLFLPDVIGTVRWIYASTLAYIVDANVGRSSSAVAANASFRGLFSFVATEVAVSLQVGPYCAEALTCAHLSVRTPLETVVFIHCGLV